MEEQGSTKKREIEEVGVTMDNEEMQNHSPFENFPSDFIMEIFLLLPTIACLKCKLVCKAWYDIITNREFANERCAHGYYRSILLQGSFYGRRKELMLLDLDRSSKVDEKGNLTVGYLAALRIQPKLSTSIAKLHLVNECNGLICLKAKSCWSPFIICNLLTGQQWTVKSTYKENAYIHSCGLGHFLGSDESGQPKDYFKVLRILESSKKPHFVAEIQTLGTNEWRSVVGQVPRNKLGRAFLNGSLHGYSYDDNCMWSFDCGEEKFSPVPLSDELKRNQITGVSTFDSCLCCRTTISKETGLSEFWVMENYGNKDSWVKHFSLVENYRSVGMPFLRMDSGKVMFMKSGYDDYQGHHGPYLIDCTYLTLHDLESNTRKLIRFLSKCPDYPSKFCTSFGVF